MNPAFLASGCKLYEQTIHGDEVQLRMRFPIDALQSRPNAFTDTGELASLSLVVFACSNAGALIAALNSLPPHIHGACNMIAEQALDAREELLSKGAKP